MRKNIIVVLGALLAVPSSGCWFLFDDDSGYSDDGYDYEDSWTDGASRTVTWDRLDADLGGHQIELASVAGTANTSWGTTIEIDTQEGGSWAMFRLEVGTDLYDPDLEDAVLLSATDSVTLLGCTGDAPYQYDYDGYASDVEVEVFQGVEPGTRRVDFRATFADGGAREVTGSVVLDLNAPAGDVVYGDPGTTSPGSTSTFTSTVTWEAISSDVGDQGRFALSTVEGSGYGDGYYSTVEFETSEPGQWVLFRLSTYAQDLFQAPVGTVVEGADLMGCTGDAPHEYDYDGYAVSARVEILPGASENERIGHVTGSFDTEWGSQSIDASFRYEVR